MSVTAIFYLLAYFGGLAKALAGKPIWGLYVYFLCFYFHAPTQWWGQGLPHVRWALIAALVTMLCLFIYPTGRPIRFWEFRENKWLTALAALVVIQTPFTINSSSHGEYTFLLIKFMIFIFLVQNILWRAEDVKKIIWINLFGGAYLAYMGMSMHSGGRLEGIGTPGMNSANHLGQQFAVLVFMGGYLLLEKFNRMHIFVGFCLCMILMAMFMTESRGVILAVGAAGAIAPFFVPKGSKKKFSMFGALALVAGISLMGPQIIERFQGMKKDGDGQIQDASAGSRMVIIKAQLEMAKHSPIIGHGHQGTLFLSPTFIPPEYHAAGVGARASHNTSMAFLVDHGGIGLFIYLGLTLVCGWRLWDVRKSVPDLPPAMQEEFRVLSNIQTGLLLALLCFFVAGLGSNNKKLEGDIWVFALAPVVAHRMNRILKKQERYDRLRSLEDNEEV